jgi:hypothetical protein
MSFPQITYLSSEALYQQYEKAPAMVGTLGMDQFGDLYRLCKAGSSNLTDTPEYPVANANVIADGVTGDMSTCDLYSDTAAIGDLVIRIDDTNSSTDRPANHFEGGYAYFYGGATTERQARRVVSSTVGTDASLYITLDAPLTVAITDGAVDVYPSQYSNCVKRQSTQAYETFVAYPLVAPITAGYYFWGHTRGPQLGHYRSSYPGTAASDIDVYFDYAGTISTAPDTNGGAVGTISPQRAGYGIMCNAAAYGCVFFMLQLE